MRVGIILCLLSLSSCLQKTVSNKNTRNTNSSGQYTNPNSPPNDRGDDDTNYDGGGGGNSGGGEGNSYGDGTESGVVDAGQDLNYYTIQNIVVKGRAHPYKGNPNDPFWSSLSNFPSQNRHIFYTDSRFNLRVIPRSAPSQNSKFAADGSLCKQQPLNYDRLQIDVCVRSVGSSCDNFNTTTFRNIAVDGASKVKEYPVPVTSDPLVVEIKDVQWDWACDYYGNPTSGSGAQYCPFSAVGYEDCVRFDFQFSTDDTKDLPGPRL